MVWVSLAPAESLMMYGSVVRSFVQGSNEEIPHRHRRYLSCPSAILFWENLGCAWEYHVDDAFDLASAGNV